MSIGGLWVVFRGSSQGQVVCRGSKKGQVVYGESEKESVSELKWTSGGFVGC